MATVKIKSGKEYKKALVSGTPSAIEQADA